MQEMATARAHAELGLTSPNVSKVKKKRSKKRKSKISVVNDCQSVPNSLDTFLANSVFEDPE